MFDITMWKDENGYSPVDDFLDVLYADNIKLYVKTMRNLGLLEATGNMLGMPYSKPLGDGIFELRSSQGSNISRLFYFFEEGGIIIVDHAILKKTQKIPAADLELALERKADYERRQKDDLQRKA